MPHLNSKPAIPSFHTSYHFLAVPFPFCLSTKCPPQGFPLLLSWLPAAHCEVGFRLLSWALTALLSLALMQVDFHLLFDLASLLPPTVPFPVLHHHCAENNVHLGNIRWIRFIIFKIQMR